MPDPVTAAEAFALSARALRTCATDTRAILGPDSEAPIRAAVAATFDVAAGMIETMAEGFAKRHRSPSRPADHVQEGGD